MIRATGKDNRFLTLQQLDDLLADIGPPEEWAEACMEREGYEEP